MDWYLEGSFESRDKREFSGESDPPRPPPGGSGEIRQHGGSSGGRGSGSGAVVPTSGGGNFGGRSSEEIDGGVTERSREEEEEEEVGGGSVSFGSHSVSRENSQIVIKIYNNFSNIIDNDGQRSGSYSAGAGADWHFFVSIFFSRFIVPRKRT